jgi:hypothetical protein
MTLDEIRNSPEGLKFSGMSDQEMADQIWRDHYTHMPRDEFDTKIGLKKQVTTQRPMLSEAVTEARRQFTQDAPGEITSVMSQINEDNIASALGLPVDVASSVLRFVGADPGDAPVGGSDWLRNVMRATGASSRGETLSSQITGQQRGYPKTTTGKAVAAIGGGATEAVLTGAGTGSVVRKVGERFAKPTLEKVGQVISSLRGNIVAGGGGGAGGEIGRDVGKGSPLEKPLSVVGELVGGGVAGVVDPSVRLRPPRTRVPDPVLDSYERLKLVPTVAERGIGGRGLEWIQGNLLPQTVGGGTVMETFRQQRMRELTGIQQDIAAKYGNVTQREAMGADIKKDVMDTWLQIKQKDGEIIGGLKSKYGSENVYAGELIKAVASPIGAATTGLVRESTLDPEIIKMADVIRNTAGNFTINDLAALKTKFGYLLEPGFQKNVNDAQVSQLYKAVTDDMENYIRNRSPQEYRALKDANARYAQAQRDFSAHFKKLVGTGDIPVSGERAYEIVAGAATEKGRADLQKFRQVWDAMTPTTRGNLSATILGRMGSTDKSDVANWQTWQLGKFLTEYRSLSTEAKDMLFGQQKDVARSLDDLIAVTQNMQERMLKLASSSRSGTGALVLGQFGIGGIISHLMDGGWISFKAAMFGYGGPWTAAQVLTDPRLTRALAATINKFGNGIDGAGRAVMDLAAVPRAGGKKAIIPQQIIDQSQTGGP